MNTTSHTPGPWTAEKRLSTEITIRASDQTVIAGARCDSYLPAYEAEANAHLIAAAPLMLQTLSAIVKLLDGSQPKDTPGAVMAAQSAIAAASPPSNRQSHRAPILHLPA